MTRFVSEILMLLASLDLGDPGRKNAALEIVQAIRTK
jgi:hypothetical protein